MRRTIVIAFIVSGLIFGILGCAAYQSEPQIPAGQPHVEREFRAAWVATVANINWPSKRGLSTEQQQAEVVAILDRLQQLNFNAVVLQVRAQCDAFYASDLEPWSYYLTGIQGQAPEPYYDPLEFWIAEAHQRGIELHAWLNPYRAHHVAGGPVTEHSIVEKRPELAKKLASGYWWLDPAKAGTREHTLAVTLDIVRRYDIDGIHIDDYFYPYPSYNDGQDFPDDDSWAEYRESGGKLNRGDWRRAGVDEFVERVYREIKAEKPHVKFGVSPFGIWRPGYPESIQGFDQYDQLYADARLWLRKGWLDYWSPQLYWAIDRVPQSYPVLLNWWRGENIKQRHLWPGLNSNRPGPEGADETIDQVMITRGLLADSPGNIHYSFSTLVTNNNLAGGLLKGPYKKPALVPPSPWLDKTAPDVPAGVATIDKDKIRISFSHPEPADVFLWVVYSRYGNRWDYTILNEGDASFELPLYSLGALSEEDRENPESIDVAGVITVLNEVRLTAVDRVGNESEPALIDIPGHDLLVTLTGAEILGRYAEDHPGWYWAQRNVQLEQAFRTACLYSAPLKELKYNAVDSLLHLLQERYPKQFNYAWVGTSVEGRPINLMSMGTGETTILLWSQMHGDEPTATAALFAVFNYLGANPDDPVVRTVLEKTTILALPMLNPDGAEYSQRRNMQGIDINRDARDLQTPEGQTLLRIKEEYQPDFGFNLHDMSTRETVSGTANLVSLALMAPPINQRNDSSPALERAKQLTTVILDVLEPVLAGHIAKYDADYMPRAFGDSMQSWGVSTILIESAGWFGAADEFLQKTNFIAYLACFEAIATGSYTRGDPDRYEQLPTNGRELYDLVIRDVTLVDGSGLAPFKTDIAVNYYNGEGRFADLGDLDVFTSKTVIDGTGLILTPGFIGLLDARNIPENNFLAEAQNLLAGGYTTLIGTVSDNSLKAGISSIMESAAFRGRWELAVAVDRKLSGQGTILALLEQLDGTVGIISVNQTVDQKQFGEYSKKPVVDSNAIGKNLILTSLEPGTIRQLSTARADLWQFRDRGRIRAGEKADFAVFALAGGGELEIKAVYVGGNLAAGTELVK